MIFFPATSVYVIWKKMYFRGIRLYLSTATLCCDLEWSSKLAVPPTHHRAAQQEVSGRRAS